MFAFHFKLNVDRFPAVSVIAILSAPATENPSQQNVVRGFLFYGHQVKSRYCRGSRRHGAFKKGFNVLKPVGDRLPYDLALDLNGRLLRIQVKHAWYCADAECHIVDVRRSKTNRRILEVDGICCPLRANRRVPNVEDARRFFVRLGGTGLSFISRCLSARVCLLWVGKSAVVNHQSRAHN